MFTELQDAGKGINRLPANKGLEVLDLSQSNICDVAIPASSLIAR